MNERDTALEIMRMLGIYPDSAQVGDESNDSASDVDLHFDPVKELTKEQVETDDDEFLIGLIIKTLIRTIIDIIRKE